MSERKTKMKCELCSWFWADNPSIDPVPICHADPNWPAPCEEEEMHEDEGEY